MALHEEPGTSRMTEQGKPDLIENAVAGIVITAQTFNPSIFTETWLAKNGLVPAEALVGLKIFSPEVAQFQTDKVQVQVIPAKMQVTFELYGKGIDVELPRNVVRRVIGLLPHTPYQALGLNFDFFVSPPAGKDFIAYNRAFLGDGENKILLEFSAPDAKFGRYFSRDIGDARLKLDIKPVQASPTGKDLLQFSFNFHHEASRYDPEIRVKKLKEWIDGWASNRKYVEAIVSLGAEVR